MTKKHDGATPEHGRHQPAHTAPTTEQMRTIGQRRRDAEEKLEHHLAEARGKDGHHGPIQEPGPARSGEGDGPDVAGIQNDDRLTAADWGDMTTNQALPEPVENQARNTSSERN